MTTTLWTWLMGYLIVRFKGPKVERVLNAAARDGITLWGIERLTTDIVIARLTVRQFRQLRPILRSCGVNAAIFERQGLPFILSQLSRRLFFIVGLAAAVVLIAYLSSFVWFIEVTGSEEVPAEDILNVAVAHGLYSGLPKKAVNKRALEAELLSSFPMLAWANVRVEGTRAIIEVVERLPEEYDPNLLGDMVAAYGGIVTDVFVARGTAKVHPGDVVEPGTLLISGTYYDSRGQQQRGRAQGVVLARIWRESYAEAALWESYQVNTGRIKSQFRVKLGGWVIPLGPASSFDAYSTSDRTWQLKIGDVKLPVQFIKREFQEIQYERRFIPREMAEELALEEAWRKLEQDGVSRDSVSQTQITTVNIPDAEGIRVILKVELEQNIGEFQEN